MSITVDYIKTITFEVKVNLKAPTEKELSIKGESVKRELEKVLDMLQEEGIIEEEE